MGGTIGLQYLAFSAAPLVIANAVAYAWPMLVASHAVVTRSSPSARSGVAFAAVGFTGVICLFVGRGGGAGGAPLLGLAAAAGSALTMAWYTVEVARARARTIDLLSIGTGAGAIAFTPPALAGPSPELWALALSAGIGVAMLAVGYGLWTAAMRSPMGPDLAPAAYLTPLLSTVILVMAGQGIDGLGAIGCLLIGGSSAGIAVTHMARRKTLSSRPGPPAARAVPRRSPRR